MKTKKTITILLAVLLLVSICGCTEPAGGEQNTPSNPTSALTDNQKPSDKQIISETAQALALNHAGFTADQVTGLRAEYEIDDGVPEYEIEFREGDHEYDYTVHAETGEVLAWNKEYDPPKSTAPANDPTNPPADEPADPPVEEPTDPPAAPEKEPTVTPTEKPVAPTAPPAEKLTKAEAEAAALKHAGFTADQVTGLRTEYEIDDGVPEYEVDFRKGDYEYDYTIHAETGAVLTWDKEYDPVKTSDKKTTSTDTGKEELTAEEAKAVALKHAGFTADQVTGLRAEKDRDDGIWIYEINFNVDRMEYEYEIHAETGEILFWEKDRD